MAFKYYKSFIELFNENVLENKDKIAFIDPVLNTNITFSNLQNSSKKIGSFLTKYNKRNKAVIIYMEKSINVVISMLSAIYSGNYYTLIDPSMPNDRIKMMADTINPFAVITNSNLVDDAKKAFLGIDVINFDEAINTNIDEEKLDKILKDMVTTDPIFAIFTSGSSGAPKGTIISHQNLISYINWYITEFDMTNKTIFGGQTQFYFSASVSDLYSTLIMGATYVIIPKLYFSFPIKLVEVMNEYKVNTIYWVPSALAIVANLKVFDCAKPEYLEKVLFAGEIMHTKHLNYWRRHINCLYANLFGPTETVDICTFYKVNREFSDDETLPIGNGCKNVDAMVLDDNDNLVTEKNAIGELVIRSPFVGLGYYNNKEKTDQAFVNNPLNKAYHEYVYRTGDLVYYNEFNELMYAGRKDNQIKHMGYRIELSEIDVAASSMDKMKACINIYDKDVDEIIIIYEGRLTEEEIRNYLATKVPDYMIPNRYVRVKQMTYNLNGKIDRAYLKAHYKEL
ncbi:MAG: AMP-binding protein [Acholeplasmatales bacterium]|nr:AMP-binding protein [Acholeplasmatales bacterium]